MRIGFLFNHDQVHQVAHALPVALALIAERPDWDVVVATTTPALADEVRRLAARGGGVPPIVELRLRRPLTRALAWTLDWALPVRKLGIYRDQLPFFRGLDALVVAEKSSLLLKLRYGLDRLSLIHTRHGAGDRAIGFNRESARFDHVLVSGVKIRDRLVVDAGVDPARMTVVGYPKFDLPAPAPRPLFADMTKPIVLYNPHPSPHLSSWYRHGQAVLERFAADDRYNLIFAPHVMLFHRRLVLSIDRLRLGVTRPPARRYRTAPNIHVDLGSPASTDMTYTALADVYLGDASSQVYEFLRYPRPCLFLDAHGTAWEGDPNHAHWQAGPVIDSPDALPDAVDAAFAGHARYRPVQARLFADSFDLTDQPSSVRAARAIVAAVGAGAASGRPVPAVSAPMPATVPA